MKTLHKINIIALAINLVLFVVPMLGMLAMMGLGAVQLVLATIITSVYYRALDKKRRSILLRYWLFVAVDFAGIAWSNYHDRFSNDLFSVPFLFIFPACIAIYFGYTTYSITKYLGHGNAVLQH